MGVETTLERAEAMDTATTLFWMAIAYHCPSDAVEALTERARALGADAVAAIRRAAAE